MPRPMIFAVKSFSMLVVVLVVVVGVVVVVVVVVIVCLRLSSFVSVGVRTLSPYT